MRIRRPGFDPRVLRLVALASALLLAGCPRPDLTADTTEPYGDYTPPPPSRGHFKVGKPYKVAGNWYYPRIDYEYDESGIASWYGPNFQGRLTANGELFDMYKVSAAHKTLPLPSVVRVTNLENGRSLVLRVNDRGPFVRGRIIDLSKRAAELLGFADKGTAMVRVQVEAVESHRAAIEAGAEGMPEFGPKAPEASPSVAVSVESLAPKPGTGPTGRYLGAAEEPSVQVASRDAAADRGLTSTPPPFDAVSGAGGGVPDSSTPRIGVLVPFEPAPGAAPPGAKDKRTPEERRREETFDPALAAARGAEVTVADLYKRSNIYIQAGAFARFDNANRLRARLASLGAAAQISQVYITNQPMFRVRIGPLSSVSEADETLERMIRFGYPDAQIIVD